jgi:hypothetical protein
MTTAAKPADAAPPEGAQADPLPPGYEDYAGEVRVANGPAPRWLKRLPFAALALALAYDVWVRAFDPVNLVFAGLFVLWMIYTPIAQKRGWPALPL